MDAVKEQGSLYSEYSNKEQLKYGVDMIKPYLKSGFHVLDVGCGTGNLSLHALDIIGVDGSLVGIDPDPDRIQLAKKLANDRPNAKFICRKGSDIPLEERDKFDVAFSNVVFHWIDNKEKKATINNVYRVLKPGGLFLLQHVDQLPPMPVKTASFLGEEYLEKLENILHMISPDDLTTMCKETGFEVLHTETFDNEVIWQTLRGFLTFLTATVGGVIDFRKVEDKLEHEGKEIPTSWMKNGVFSHLIKVHKLVVQKPEL